MRIRFDVAAMPLFQKLLVWHLHVPIEDHFKVTGTIEILDLSHWMAINQAAVLKTLLFLRAVLKRCYRFHYNSEDVGLCEDFCLLIFWFLAIICAIVL